MAVGYDPTRLRALRASVLGAIESLHPLSSDDPAAWEAVVTVRVARDHLEQLWLPLIDRIIASDAMATWRAAPLDGAVAALAHLARNITARPQRDDVLALALSLVLIRAVGDSRAAVGFFAELGGRDTARMLLELGVPDPYADAEASRVLAEITREELAEASPRLPADFAADLVAGMVGASGEIGRDPTETLAYVLDDADHDGDFLVAAAKSVVGYERATAGIRSFDDPYWPRSLLGSTLSVDRDAETDPTDVLVERLGDDAAAWRALLTEPTVARYLLAERRFDPAGFARVAAGAALAAAGPDVVPDATAEVLHDAALVASAFVNHVGSRPDLLESAPEVSASAAHILGRYLFAVHKEVLNPEPLDQPATSRRRLDALGPDFEADVPLFDENALAAVTDLAVDTDDGLAAIRAALDAYEQGFTAAAVEASRRVVHQDPDDFLEQAIGQLGRVEAYLLRHAGHLAEDKARRRDETISRWVEGMVSGISFGVGKFGFSVPGPMLRPADLEERWARHEAAAEREFEEYADEWTERLRYLWFAELHDAGVVRPDLPASVLTADGRLRPWAELDGTERRIVQDLMEENAWRGPVDVDWSRLSDTIKVAQRELYVDLSPDG